MYSMRDSHSFTTHIVLRMMYERHAQRRRDANAMARVAVATGTEPQNTRAVRAVELPAPRLAKRAPNLKFSIEALRRLAAEMELNRRCSAPPHRLLLRRLSARARACC